MTAAEVVRIGIVGSGYIAGATTPTGERSPEPTTSMWSPDVDRFISFPAQGMGDRDAFTNA